MKWYTIFFEEQVVYEGNDGRYWFSGTTTLIHPMIFATKKRAIQGLESIQKRILAEGKQDLFSQNMEKFNVKRITLTPN